MAIESRPTGTLTDRKGTSTDLAAIINLTNTIVGK